VRGFDEHFLSFLYCALNNMTYADAASKMQLLCEINICEINKQKLKITNVKLQTAFFLT